MSNEKQETIEDIVAAMRNESHAGDESCLEWVGAKKRTYADRIESAAKREREAGAEAAQVCGEAGEMIGREATREKSSQVGNAAKMREALEYALDRLLLWNYTNRYTARMALGVVNKLNAAISAPPRNCDRPECATTKAAQDVWRKEDGGKTAYYEWLLATSTKGETK